MPDLPSEVVRAENIERRRQKARLQAERHKVSGKRDAGGEAAAIAVLNEIFAAYHAGKTSEAQFHAALRSRCGYSQRFIDRHAQEWRELR
jgi:hypothetical protein